MIVEESISHTLILFSEVQLILDLYNCFIVPNWKAPIYNSPSQNFKRGMYAMSTAALMVFISYVIIYQIDRALQSLHQSRENLELILRMAQDQIRVQHLFQGGIQTSRVLA